MLDCVGLNSEHTVDNLREVLEETWKLDLSNMASITCDDASANKKQDFTRVPPALSIACTETLTRAWTMMSLHAGTHFMK